MSPDIKEISAEGANLDAHSALDALRLIDQTRTGGFVLGDRARGTNGHATCFLALHAHNRRGVSVLVPGFHLEPGPGRIELFFVKQRTSQFA
jgi:hypothetical protein